MKKGDDITPFDSSADSKFLLPFKDIVQPKKRGV
jgi:hypothetical protein